MNVPFFSPLVQNAPLATELEAKFKSVLDSGYFILGPEVEAFEAEVAAYLGVPHAVGVSSGTDALLVALMALGIAPGDEVIVPSFTFFATAGVVQRVGAIPVFADVCPACYQIQPTEVERLITDKTRAVIPVHLFGHTADVEAIVNTVASKNIAVVEDVAQSMGAKVGEHFAGTVGKLGCFSFFPTKNLGGFGDGGVVVTQDTALAEKMRQLRNHGMYPKYYHAEVGGNFRLDALQAALLRTKLPHLDSYLEQRQLNAERYVSGLLSFKNVEESSVVSGGRETMVADGVALLLPGVEENRKPTWNQFTLRVKNRKRDALREFLNTEGIGCEVYYPVPLHRQECFLVSGEGEPLFNTERLCEEVLSLPVYPELEMGQIDYVIEKVSHWLSQQ